MIYAISGRYEVTPHGGFGYHPNFVMVNLKVSTDKPLMADAVRVILSTILFHRALGPINPKTVESLGVTYAVPDLQNLETDLKAKLSALATYLQTHEHATITLRFFDPTTKKAWFTWSDACWEEWVIRCQLDKGDLAMIQQDLSELILKIIQVMDHQKEHIPPITSKNVVVFPYEIRVG